MNINLIWDYSKTRLRSLNNLNNKTKNVEINYLNGYDAIRYRLDEHNTLTVKQPVVNETDTTTKASIGLTQTNSFHFYNYIY